MVCDEANVRLQGCWTGQDAYTCTGVRTGAREGAAASRGAGPSRRHEGPAHAAPARPDAGRARAAAWSAWIRTGETGTRRSARTALRVGAGVRPARRGHASVVSPSATRHPRPRAPPELTDAGGDLVGNLVQGCRPEVVGVGAVANVHEGLWGRASRAHAKPRLALGSAACRSRPFGPSSATADSPWGPTGGRLRAPCRRPASRHCSHPARGSPGTAALRQRCCRGACRRRPRSRPRCRPGPPRAGPG